MIEGSEDRTGLIHKINRLIKQTYVSAVAPTVNNDGVDTAALGRTFQVGDRWVNTVLQTTKICYDNSTGAAVWA